MSTTNEATITGPAEVWALDADVLDNIDQPISVELVRSTGSVLVKVMAMPRHSHFAGSDEFSANWLWAAEPTTPIYVPEGQFVSLIASRPVRPWFQISQVRGL